MSDEAKRAVATATRSVIDSLIRARGRQVAVLPAHSDEEIAAFELENMDEWHELAIAEDMERTAFYGPFDPEHMKAGME